MKVKQKFTRRFMGDVDTSKYEELDKEDSKYANSIRRRFHKKHLQAYLRGHDRFIFGKDIERKPVYYDVIYIVEPLPNG